MAFAGTRQITSALCVLLLLPSAEASSNLRVRVVDGEGAVHSFRSRTGAALVVEVVDAQLAPVAGAKVRFSVPATGPGGIFANGEPVLEVETNTNGRAGTIGFIPNERVGKFPVTVSVTSNMESAQLTVSQENGTGRFDDGIRAPRSGWKWWVAGLAAAGAGVGLAIALRGGSSTTPGGWKPGAPDIGAPR